MNKRIQELADQAAEHAIELTVKYPELYIPTFTEKFAELIVRECSQVSLTVSHRNDDMGAIIARMIKQYFGVE